MKKNCNRAKNIFTKTWLAGRKANIINVTQAGKRKQPPKSQAQIELLDTSEEDGGGNEAASAKLKAGEESDTELSNAQDD